MRVILGTYRGPELVFRALRSLQRSLRGWTSLTIVDDSGNEEWAEVYRRVSGALFLDTGNPDEKWLNPIPVRVVTTGGVGYALAMQAVTAEARREGERFMFWEEDFTLLEPVDLADMGAWLDKHPGHAQVALLRGPHFPIEHRYGGLLAALVKRLGSERVDLKTLVPVSPLGTLRPHPATRILGYSQRGVFTCNPAVWEPVVAELGWPSGEHSEDAVTADLVSRGYRFGYLPDILVEHDGERSGYGY